MPAYVTFQPLSNPKKGGANPIPTGVPTGVPTPLPTGVLPTPHTPWGLEPPLGGGVHPISKKNKRSGALLHKSLIDGIHCVNPA